MIPFFLSVIGFFAGCFSVALSFFLSFVRTSENVAQVCPVTSGLNAAQVTLLCTVASRPMRFKFSRSVPMPAEAAPGCQPGVALTSSLNKNRGCKI